MARGPSFKKGKTVRHFYNIEIYNMIAGKFPMFDYFPAVSLNNRFYKFSIPYVCCNWSVTVFI